MHPLDIDFVVSFVTNSKRYYNIFGRQSFAGVARGILQHDEMAHVAIETAGLLEEAITETTHIVATLSESDKTMQKRVCEHGLDILRPEEILKIFSEGRLMLAILEAVCHHKKMNPSEYVRLYESYYLGA